MKEQINPADETGESIRVYGEIIYYGEIVKEKARSRARLLHLFLPAAS